jgi:hypothetical protein
VNVNTSPSFTSKRLFSISPTLNLGPCKSPSIATVHPNSSLMPLMLSIIFFLSS